MIDHDLFTILELILEMAVGLIAIIAFHMRMSGGGLSSRDLMNRIQKQDREIERLRLTKQQHNYRTIQNKHKHLHLSDKRYTL